MPRRGGIAALLLLAAVLLQGCPFGEAPPAYGAIEALSLSETPKEAAAAIRQLALSAGFERQTGEIEQIEDERIRFALRCCRISADIVIEPIPAGTDIVLKFNGGWGEDFDEVAEPGYSRLKALLIDRYGRSNVATGNSLYCCGLRERYAVKEPPFR
jgi:hypothetical protein